MLMAQPAGEGLAGVVMMNGAPVAVEQWSARLKDHPKLRVHMSAGLQVAQTALESPLLSSF